MIRFFFLEPGPIAKSSIVLDVKPWDDETDLVALEKEIRKIQTDGLIWGPGMCGLSCVIYISTLGSLAIILASYFTEAFLEKKICLFLRRIAIHIE